MWNMTTSQKISSGPSQALLEANNALGFIYLFIYLFIFFILVPDLQHMEVPRLGVESELQLLAYPTATAMWDPSRIFDLHHSSRQCRILNPLSEARDQTCILMDAGQIHFR